MSRPATLLLCGLLAAASLAGCGDEEPAAVTEPSPSPEGQCRYVDTAVEAAREVDRPPADPDPDAPAGVVLHTSAGDIPLTFDTAQAPCTVNSFLSLAQQGYFDDTICHRVTTKGYFVLQCGDPSGTGTEGPGYAFADELVPDDERWQPCGEQLGQAYCTYTAGTVAMANSGPDTNGSQFFLVYGNSRFPPAYTIFGHLDAAGLKVVRAIGAKGVAADRMGPGDGPPKEKVTITGVAIPDAAQ